MALSLLAQPPRATREAGHYLDRRITIEEQAQNDSTAPTLAPATICVDGPPQRQCYTAPENFGANAAVEKIDLLGKAPALLFSVDNGGPGLSTVRFVILRPDDGDKLNDILYARVETSNQNQHRLLQLPEMSEHPILVVASAVFGPDEGHHGRHRFEISMYAHLFSQDLNDDRYTLIDRFMTVARYNVEESDIIGAESKAVLRRLRALRKHRAKHPWPGEMIRGK